MPKVSNTVACYVRVSTVGQNEAGQKEEIKRWLQGNGVDPKVVVWYVDKMSGDNMARPSFKRMQADIFAGEISTVVIYKLDRLSRKIRDGIDALCAWCDKGLRVVSVTQQIDFSGTVGQIIAAVLLGVAQMEQENRRERQAVGIAVAKKQGKYKGRRSGTTKAAPERAVELREKGLRPEEIASALGVSRNTVFRYFREAS
ncbi:recombinase family protein [Fuerstiella marisgermanici]|uniref:DNA-invertase hin n=1 Tax=Fuerstiella marisgermanici TaxID=1891926 RepID=A0A1P8WBX0_9PLAN|nr:recombinase family protein [Fuerstiella marisgermanici]APZ91552.1 DNA-invertase hin [Fuerstiella marisgermanici]